MTVDTVDDAAVLNVWYCFMTHFISECRSALHFTKNQQH